MQSEHVGTTRPQVVPAEQIVARAGDHGQAALRRLGEGPERRPGRHRVGAVARTNVEVTRVVRIGRPDQRHHHRDAELEGLIDEADGETGIEHLPYEIIDLLVVEVRARK